MTDSPRAGAAAGRHGPARELSELLRSGRLAHANLVDGSGVLLDTDTLQVYALNDTAAEVVVALRDGVTDERELRRRLATAFEVDEETASSDLARYLELLRAMVLGSAQAP